MSTDRDTGIYGVVGHPLKHSLSPVMHNAAFSALGLNALYLAFETEDPEGCAKGTRAFHIKGLSVTSPLKSSIIPFLDEVEDLARTMGAVNTIVNREGRLTGYNTDAMGALKALEEKGEISGKTCLILGAGGAARAIGFILKERGVHLILANRSERRGKDLAALLDCPFVPLKEIDRIRPDVLIQATTVGMHPNEKDSPISADVLEAGMLVMDIIYNPLETKLLRMARAKGCLTINGLGMFIGQGAAQFKLWTGLEAPVEIMTRAVEEVLQR